MYSNTKIFNYMFNRFWKCRFWQLSYFQIGPPTMYPRSTHVFAFQSPNRTLRTLGFKHSMEKYTNNIVNIYICIPYDCFLLKRLKDETCQRKMLFFQKWNKIKIKNEHIFTQTLEIIYSFLFSLYNSIHNIIQHCAFILWALGI